MQMPEAHPPPVEKASLFRGVFVCSNSTAPFFLPEVKNNYRLVQFSLLQDSLSSSSYRQHLRCPSAQQAMPGDRRLSSRLL